MTIRLDARNRPEPDLLLTNLPYDPDRTWYAPEDVKLVVEAVSPESAHRDRTVKLRKYAEAGIPHYWCIEDEDGAPVVHVYELDEPTGTYAPMRHLPRHPPAPGPLRGQPGPRQAHTTPNQLKAKHGNAKGSAPDGADPF